MPGQDVLVEERLDSSEMIASEYLGTIRRNIHE